MERPRTRARAGEGEARGNRRLVRVTIDGVRRRLGSCASTDEAVDLRQAIRDGAGDAAGVTLAAWGPAWLDERETVDKIRGIDTERSRWQTHVAPAPFYGRPLAQITPGDIEAWLVAMSKKKTANPRRPPTLLDIGTIRSTLSLLRQAFAAAIPRHIGTSPAADPAVTLRLKRIAKARQQDEDETDDPWTYLEPHEQRALFELKSAPESHRLVIAFAVLTGLRQGEQFNLELRDVHVGPQDAEPWLTVRFGSKGKKPKNGKVRHVALSPEAARVCRRWLELLPAWVDADKRRAKGRDPNPSGLMFPGPTGARMSTGKTPLVKSRWVDAPEKGKGAKKVGKVDLFKTYLKAAGIERDVRWHDLRHTCASSLVAGWWGRRWTLEEVREQLGHKAITTTQRYAHLGESALRQAARATPGWADALPTPGHSASEQGDLSARNCWVGRRGLEPWTNGLKDSDIHEQYREVKCPSGQPGGQLAPALRTRLVAALAAAAEGDPRALDLFVRIASDILEAERATEAIDARASGTR